MREWGEKDMRRMCNTSQKYIGCPNSIFIWVAWFCLLITLALYLIFMLLGVLKVCRGLGFELSWHVDWTLDYRFECGLQAYPRMLLQILILPFSSHMHDTCSFLPSSLWYYLANSPNKFQEWSEFKILS